MHLGDAHTMATALQIYIKYIFIDVYMYIHKYIRSNTGTGKKINACAPTYAFSIHLVIHCIGVLSCACCEAIVISRQIIGAFLPSGVDVTVLRSVTRHLTSVALW